MVLFRTPQQVLPVELAIEKDLVSLTKTQVTGDVTVREMLPDDLVSGKNDWSWTGLTAGAWNTIVNLETPDNTFYAIYGIVLYDTSQTVTQVKISVGGAVKRWIPTAKAFDGSQYGKVIYFGKDEALIIQPNSQLKIDIFATDTTVNMAILGKVGEQLGRRIMKTSG